MNQRELMLAAFGASKLPYKPVQIQKIIYIFQEKATAIFRDKPFNFRAYNYGPFSIEVYSCLDSLAVEGNIIIDGEPFSPYRRYCLTESGKELAASALGLIPEHFREYLVRLADWVHTLSFAQLVGAVYKEFPAMRANSVFRD